MKNKKPTSFRIHEEIVDNFKEVCDKLQVKPSYVVSELMKDFIIRNINKEPYESAEILNKSLGVEDNE